MIEIAATGADPVELAKIVNEIARLYTNLRQAERAQASYQGLDALPIKMGEKGERS